MGNYTDSQTEKDSSEKVSEKETAKTNTDNSFKRHKLSIEYNYLTILDFAVEIAYIFDEPPSHNGAISIDYGYLVGSSIETGLIFNYFISGTNPVITAMPKFKLNASTQRFVNPFFEIDLGITYSGITNKVMPMAHITILGFEIGNDVFMRFQVPFLLWGQRGITYYGVGVRF